ncbi:SDR family NAD(P)-dependent oxidoreductase [Bradyrhizobium prioriisuperbiae]|uniref:SDR family NAD(P)-dependent oxidoreductase n=1 Tax=Bradyrhizobium prioriisuperbiae TaxID=2854389 RepID=UPI0028E2A569|nr:SDR family oxidoreductase [Bradyrhizobium prioritasuperba]
MANKKRAVLVTGGSRGLGLAIVRDLLLAGYCVAACSRNRSPELVGLETEFSEERFLWTECEIGLPNSENRAVSQFFEWASIATPYGLVNNAGIAAEGILATFPTADLERVIQVNLLGALRVARLMTRSFLHSRTEGRIINISSIIGSRGYSGLAAYSASKAGIDGLTRSLAREVGPRKITVNSIAPGYLVTEMSDNLSSSQRSQIERRTPIGRLGNVSDVTPVVRFLLSDEAQFMTGQTLTVDGGLTC